MICCLLIALALAPLGVSAAGLTRNSGGTWCCRPRARMALVAGGIAITACAAMLLYAQYDAVPVLFRHICSVGGLPVFAKQ